MSGMSVADLVKCRDASVLLGAFNMHTNDDGDDEIHDFFFAPGLERLELLCWVLVAIDPSGKHERELNTGEDSAAALTKRATSVLSHLNPRRVKEFAAFARGTAPVSKQKPIWELLLGTAEFVQNLEEGSSGSSAASCAADMTFKPTVASTPMPQAEPTVASLSNMKHEGKAAKCLWQSDDLAAPGVKSAAGTDPVDHVIEQLEEAILVSKKRLAALEASQEPEEPPLDAPLCARYRRAAEELARAGDCMAQVPPPRVPPVVLDEEGEKLIADTLNFLRAFRNNVCYATLLNAMEGHAQKGRSRDTGPKK
ncbi:uncharacterized protein LOC119373376 [Rhipicephalus sanguineus]|uniref:uncharacterized protein LOC119373376 n=1 Tax=Rhipicephalus sanguineus TaxID=34632 RepID=UPI001894F635|nr:uncharacterized protein LOC119373376 [Rhipicephalus sanguineus]XP_049276377.1 uncharacterized protein LOC119373376 [Rhipicephalus sanguineus]